MTEKIRKKSVTNKVKMGRPAPNWLHELKDGIYTANELANISKKTFPNITQLMKKYAKKITYVVQENARASARYHWEKEYFLKLITNKNAKKIDTELT